ncbi:xylulokinase [Neptunomonas antarctica]|uniref:Xylulose kinase n=1 Tax=Neptunomonas antarctica TaxID=619304 RepID=A0A1N7L2X1_9GAMM|nr:xylulokinase [Neptunomonas antarctica]SIS68000.1 xylulokinase [Neptunomonas antarctica]
MYLGVDCGTQGTKVIILNPELGCIIGEGYEPHQLISNARGRREQHPDWWIAAFKSAYHQAIEQSGIDAKAIHAIGVSGQQHGLVALDQQGNVIRPAKLWCDTETEPQNQQLLAALGGENLCKKRLGLVIATGYTASKLLWMKQNCADDFRKIAHILLPHDYFNFWLTGNTVTEYGDASGTGYFNVITRQWDRGILDIIDPNEQLSKALPNLIEAHQPAGIVRKEIASLLGLSPNVLVSSGGGDNMMGAIGTGNITPGLVTMSLGTSGTLYAAADKPITPVNNGLAPFCSSTGGWLPLICTMNMTNITSAMQQLFEFDIPTFNQHLASIPAGSDGLLLMPFLNGERTPSLPSAEGMLLGINMQNLTPPHLCRAAVEGTTLGLRYGLEILRDSGLDSASIRLIGGGAKSNQWRQITADMMNTPVECPSIGEAAALGGAIQAAWCHSHWQGKETSLNNLCNQFVAIDSRSRVEPNQSGVQHYKELFEQYNEALHHHYNVLYDTEKNRINV